MLCVYWAAQCPACACRWSWPKTFLHGEGAAVGIAIFNSVGALGGFCGARSARECIVSGKAGAHTFALPFRGGLPAVSVQCKSAAVWYEPYAPCVGILDTHA